MNIRINTSCAKSFFKENDIRSEPDAVEKFKELLIVKGLEIAKAAANAAIKRNRKTVSVLDFEETSLDKEDNEDDEEEEIAGNDDD